MSHYKRITSEVTIRFRDLDAMRHVNNAVHFTYFEEGRKNFLVQVLGGDGVEKVPFILAYQRCNYIRPMRIGDKVNLVTWIGEIGRKKFEFKYRLLSRDDDSVIYAEGDSLMVMYDYVKERTMEIPKHYLEKIQEYQEMGTGQED